MQCSALGVRLLSLESFSLKLVDALKLSEF
jgi:hypothetical protein